MNTLGKTGLRVSRIGLGTVEIGLPYGIGIKDLPTDKEAETILKSAVEMGITYIDTARGYGVAEERIGKSGIATMPGVVIGTKCGQFLKNEPDLHGAELERRIREDIETSRQMLQQDQLQLVQFHNELADYTDYQEIIEIFQTIKDQGKVAHFGIASRGEAATLTAYNTNFFETSQLAYSILDQRMVKEVLQQAQTKNIGVINRSVLLKGALTPKANQLPDELKPVRENAVKAALIAEELGITLPDLAIRFV
ncbi:MAG: aldo/keto reductase, partial [Candidatus Andersenbacteria bacterium]|nr:aldo/keto reductase [Candidatus Andersenbacteria bacterium]